MSLTKKSDVKNHMSVRFRAKIHLGELVVLRDATDVATSETTQREEADFVQDFVGDHSSAARGGAPGVRPNGSISSTASPISKVSAISKKVQP
jgi:hypothetical protein